MHPQYPPAASSAVPYTVPPQPGEEFLLARLQRAQAVPPAQRTPEVAAFVEVMQLNEEACALLLLVRAPGTATDDVKDILPALPATEATARRVLLAIVMMCRMEYVCHSERLPSLTIRGHLAVYLERGCGAAYPPLERCSSELGAQLRRNGCRANAVGPYLWSYAAAIVSVNFHELHKQTAAALWQLGDALAAADLESLDLQLGELQGGASTTSSSDLLITSRQLCWSCHSASHHICRDLEHDALVIQMLAHSASSMMRLEPLNPASLLAKSAVTAQDTLRGLEIKIQLTIQGYEEAKRQRHYLRAWMISSGAVAGLGTQLLAFGARPALMSTTVVGLLRAAVEAFEEAEASYLPIKRLLPELWVSGAAALGTVARQAMPQVLRVIAEPGAAQQQPGSSSQHTAEALHRAMANYIIQLGETRCAGCGKQAQGLRKCSRCREAGYCR